jgi:hypothetical protein
MKSGLPTLVNDAGKADFTSAYPPRPPLQEIADGHHIDRESFRERTRCPIADEPRLQ